MRAVSSGLSQARSIKGDIMAQQGMVTITGYAGNNPVEFGRQGGPAACTFRLGCTRGYYDANRVWHNHPTTWITVKAFRRLAEHVGLSIRKGDAVIVVGLLNTETWTQQGEERSRIVIDATSVGPDLNGGVATLRKLQKPAGDVRAATGAGPDPFAADGPVGRLSDAFGDSGGPPAGPVEVIGAAGGAVGRSGVDDGSGGSAGRPDGGIGDVAGFAARPVGVSGDAEPGGGAARGGIGAGEEFGMGDVGVGGVAVGGGVAASSVAGGSGGTGGSGVAAGLGTAAGLGGADESDVAGGSGGAGGPGGAGGSGVAAGPDGADGAATQRAGEPARGDDPDEFAGPEF